MENVYVQRQTMVNCSDYSVFAEAPPSLTPVHEPTFIVFLAHTSHTRLGAQQLLLRLAKRPRARSNAGRQISNRLGLWLVCGCAALSSIMSGCKSASTPTGPSGESANISWTVDGASFSGSSNGRSADYLSSLFSITGSQCGTGAFLSVQFRGPLAARTYNLGEFDLGGSWTPDARTIGDKPVWVARSGKGSGSLTVSEVSSSWTKGSFEFLMSSDSNLASGTRSIRGSFSLPLGKYDGKIC